MLPIMNLLHGYFRYLLIMPVVLQSVAAASVLKSPDGKLETEFTLTAAGEPRYTIRRDGQVVLRESRLGLVRADADFSKGLQLDSESEAEPVKDHYEIPTAKRRVNNYQANRQVFHLTARDGGKLDVIFQVSNDGLAFRYSFPESSKEVRNIPAGMARVPPYVKDFMKSVPI